MAETVIRPSLKMVRVGYTIVSIIIFVCVLAAVNWKAVESWPGWLLVLPFLLLAVPLRRQIQRSFIKLTILDDKLRYETGILHKTTRTAQVAKIQDVLVDQRLWQRILRTGDLSIETAGESSRLTIADIDNPQQIAERILAASAKYLPKDKP
jgi:uncharacterized membrane protein YdbT with pleckstrin-like domain